jgi:hypothetical protein
MSITGSAVAETEPAPRVVAIYLHRTLRCQTCLQIEALARHDVTDVMANDVANGQLAWRLVNFEEEANVHFAEEFGLDGPTLVIALEDGGEVVEWARLDRVWETYDDLEAFDEYVLGTLEEFLGKASVLANGKSSRQPD